MGRLTRQEFVEKWKDIKLLALDVDGVMTDDGIFFGPDGFEMKKFNISDGFFIVLAMRAGLEIAIVSGRKSPATETRMKDLGVKHVFQGYHHKSKMLEPIRQQLIIDHSQIAFVGNELLDIELAKMVGLPIAVADASQELIDIVSYVTEKRGGEGAVREILECYFEGNNLDPKSFIVG